MMVRFFFCIVLTKTLVQTHVFVRKGCLILKIYLVIVYVHVFSCVCVYMYTCMHVPEEARKECQVLQNGRYCCLGVS